MRNSTRKLERCHPQARIDRNLLTYKANAINLRKKPKSTKDSAISKWKSLQKLNFFGRKVIVKFLSKLNGSLCIEM